MEIPLSIGIISIEGVLREDRQRKRILIAWELFWWSTSIKCELGRVVERGGGEIFRVVNLKVIYGGLMNACSERGGR
jgi:hypothetical protein